jgi:uncharacterized membrane protein
MENENNNHPPDTAVHEPGWTFRGYKMRPAEFTTAMVHYYRAEITRSNVWRTRLDTTTNWAVITAGAAISFTLSDPQHHYGVLILNTVLLTIFLWIEARRYRYYELWSLRTRLMETDFYAAMLVPPFAPHPEWDETLAESLLQPQFPISVWEAFGRRFRRNYVWIYLVMAVAWALKIYLHPDTATSWEEAIGRSTLGAIPGEWMIAAGLVFNGLLFLVGFLTAGLTQASGEVLPKFNSFPFMNGHWHTEHKPTSPEGLAAKWAAALRPIRQRHQVLAMIIAANPQDIADRVQKEMKRGVTALHGRGMYLNQERDVLLVAVAVVEIAQLKEMVRQVDPKAFVIVVPAKEISGAGFRPLDEV